MLKYFASGYDLAKEMSVPAVTLEKTFKVYSEKAKAQKDPFVKKFFQNAEFRIDDYFNVAITTPILHYTMDGLGIDPELRVLAFGETSPSRDCLPPVLSVSVTHSYSNVFYSDVLQVILRLHISCSRTQDQ